MRTGLPMAPEPIPEDLLIHAARELPASLAVRMADPLAWRRTVAHMTRQSLARIDHRGLQLHRLTQAILRDRLTPDQTAATRSRVEAILAASHPGDSTDPATWARWARLMPHLLAAEPGSADSPQIRALTGDACWYLLARGDARGSHDLADRFYRQWRERLGADDPQTAMMARTLGSALRRMGRFAAARRLDEDTMARDQRLRGDDHPDTLASAHYLALDLRHLGEVETARHLDRDTFTRRRRVLGQDHPRTLASASSLAIDLRELGNVQAACDLDKDTLARRRRVLGEDHPDTLDTANNLAIDLNKLSEKY